MTSSVHVPIARVRAINRREKKKNNCRAWRYLPISFPLDRKTECIYRGISTTCKSHIDPVNSQPRPIVRDSVLIIDNSSYVQQLEDKIRALSSALMLSKADEFTNPPRVYPSIARREGAFSSALTQLNTDNLSWRRAAHEVGGSIVTLTASSSTVVPVQFPWLHGSGVSALQEIRSSQTIGRIGLEPSQPCLFASPITHIDSASRAGNGRAIRVRLPPQAVCRQLIRDCTLHLSNAFQSQLLGQV